MSTVKTRGAKGAREPREPKLGVLGGMGPQATQVFYQYVLDRTEASCDQEHLPALILSDTGVPDRTASILTGNTEPMYQRLLADARLLEECGCTVIAIPCNTSHYFVDRIQQEIGIPIQLHTHDTSGNQVAALLLEKGADMTAVNKFGKNALQLAEEGALAYQSSFDLTKTEVSKAPVDSFIRAYEKAVAGLPPEHAPEFMEAMKKAVGRQSFVETGYVLQLITRSLSSKNLLTEEQSGKFREEITGAIAENSRIIDVRGVAFEHTVDLLRKAAEK